MKRIIILIIHLCWFVMLQAAENLPSELYSKWQTVSIDRLMKMGEEFDQRNSPDSALVCYSVIADRLQGTSDSQLQRKLATALVNKGYIYGLFYYDFQRALDMFNESLKISEECDFKQNMPYVYLNIGGVYLSCNSMYGNNLFSDEIWEYLDKAIDSGIAEKQWDVALVSFLNMGQFHFDDPQNGKIKDAIDKLKSAKISHAVALALYTRCIAEGMEAYIRKEYLSAIRRFKESIALIPQKSMHRKRLEVMSLAAIGNTQSEMGDNRGAIATFEEVLDKAKAAGASDDETRALRMLGDLYGKIGMTESASKFLLRYLHKKDSTISERDMVTLSKMPLVNELDSIKKSLEQERARKRQLLIVSSVSGLFIVLLILYLITLIRSRRKMRLYVKDLYRKNIELLEAEKRQRELRAAAEEAMNAVVTEEKQTKYAGSSLSEKDGRKIADLILKAMEQTELITSPDFTLEKLANIIGVSPKYVSQVVNETFGKNFRTFLNEYRIKEACVRLADTDTYGMLTIEHIAETLGFNSRSNFSITFKKITGLTPAQFQKNALAED